MERSSSLRTQVETEARSRTGDGDVVLAVPTPQPHVFRGRFRAEDRPGRGGKRQHVPGQVMPPLRQTPDAPRAPGSARRHRLR